MEAFEQLGLRPGASVDEVKAAWRKLASTLHPDHGGDATRFQQARQAYKQALAEAEAPKPCPQCSGEGRVPVAHGWVVIKIICGTCGGSGHEPSGNL